MLRVPFVVIGQMKFFSVQPSNQQLFDEMCAQKVFHCEGDSVLSVLEDHAGRYSDWWIVPERQAAVAVYRSNLMKPSTDYLSEWVDAMVSSGM